jgi:hypothetical protein
VAEQAQKEANGKLSLTCLQIWWGGIVQFSRRSSIMNWLVACLLIITGIVVYFPTVYIRKMNQVLKVLQEIEAHHRAALGASAVQRLTTPVADRHRSA